MLSGPSLTNLLDEHLKNIRERMLVSTFDHVETLVGNVRSFLVGNIHIADRCASKSTICQYLAASFL